MFTYLVQLLKLLALSCEYMPAQVIYHAVELNKKTTAGHLVGYFVLATSLVHANLY